ncbi:hypothetical protein [Elongatibacter sediminis]|uniref:ornithine decarboxylase n=1 Tax=Elongatibacter sediminis TaxID=3119006 RepID=A0AAW9RPB2_9GAMM
MSVTSARGPDFGFPEDSAFGLETCADTASLLARERPAEPVYCVYPEIYREQAAAFVAGFPGHVLYAVKANDHPAVIRLLNQGGVTHFDCASLAEIEQVRGLCPDAHCYFMIPVRPRGAARSAFENFGVRHFVIDHTAGLDLLADQVPLEEVVVFTRMAVSHEAALQNLSTKFGAPPESVPGLMEAVADRGAEAALAFNVGSSVTRPEAYEYAMEVAQTVLNRLPFRVRLVDVGGGFPRSYPGFRVPPLEDYFDSIRNMSARLPLADDGAILAEPGRALAAPGLSAVVEVLLRKDDRLYLNDGMFGIFWELRFKGHDRYPVRVFRDGSSHSGDTRQFSLYGPTCDSTDVLPGRVPLPADIRPGDHLEFGSLGAYSLAGRTRFNGFYSERVVLLTAPDARPPGQAN